MRSVSVTPDANRATGRLPASPAARVASLHALPQAPSPRIAATHHDPHQHDPCKRSDRS